MYPYRTVFLRVCPGFEDAHTLHPSAFKTLIINLQHISESPQKSISHHPEFYLPAMQTIYQPEIEVLEETTTEEAEMWSLVVFNDDINTFEHVTQTLIDVCGHEPEQAEQCTLLIHHKGKCTVKTGSFDEMAPMRNTICHRGISAEVL